MHKCKATCGLLVFSIALPAEGAWAVDNFQRLNSPQIQAKFVGKEMTDEVHWADIYARDGTLTTYEMGKKRTGKWSVKNDQLCHDRGTEFQGCYQVWISGKKIELRREGSSLPLEGVLQPPARRK